MVRTVKDMRRKKKGATCATVVGIVSTAFFKVALLACSALISSLTASLTSSDLAVRATSVTSICFIAS